ncbi:MAG: hypothetical protein ACOY82_02230 [Pseudomonadota bacterium]
MDLFESIRMNLAGEVRRNLAAGADPNARDAEGVPAVVRALDATVHWGDAGTVGLLRAAGADAAPLIEAVDRRLRTLPATLLQRHNHTTAAINALVADFGNAYRALAPDDRETLAEYLREAERFDLESRDLRAAAARLGEAFAHGDRTHADDPGLDEAVTLLARIGRFEIHGLGLAARTVSLRQMR